MGGSYLPILLISEGLPRKRHFRGTGDIIEGFTMEEIPR